MARQSLLESLASLPDPRLDRTRKHRLDDILMIVLIGLLGGATSFESFETFAKCREAWLRTFLQLPNGIPSHDTLHRVLSALDPKAFDALAGTYNLAPGFDLRFWREGGRFLSQATGQRQLEIFPESPTRFFLTVVDAQLDFEVGADGRAALVVLTQGGRKMPANRVP